jgi:hypothetical protein
MALIAVLAATGSHYAVSAGALTPGTEAGAPQERRDGDPDGRKVTIMTQNVAHGVDAQFAAAMSASGYSDLLNAVAAVYQGYIDANFPERAAALAAEIERKHPLLIGLQEAVLVRTQTPMDGLASPATDVAFDYLQILLDALAARDLHYVVAVQSLGLDLEAPSALGFDVRHTDREVILARADVSSEGLGWSNALGGNFATNCQLPTALLGLLTLRRSWVSVDVSLNGDPFRLLSTHLDGDCLPYTSAIQRAQAAELLANPAATTLPLVLVGDLNSRADGENGAYNVLLSAQFGDAWTAAGTGEGLTCCQASDLRNTAPTLDRRIDFVLFKPSLSVQKAVTVGDSPADMTPSGLWPSDHAGIVATLEIPRRKRR